MAAIILHKLTLSGISCGSVHVDRSGSCYSYYMRLHGDLSATFHQYQPKPHDGLEPLQQGRLGAETSNAGWVERA